MLQAHDIRMPVQLPQEDHFSEGSLGVRGILKCIEYFFYGHYSFGLFVDSFPHHPVGSFAELLQNLELLEDVRLHFFCHYMSVIILST